MIPVETEVWIECQSCGRAFGGPGIELSVRRYSDGIFCTECRPASRTIVHSHGVATARAAVTRGKPAELDLGGA